MRPLTLCASVLLLALVAACGWLPGATPTPAFNPPDPQTVENAIAAAEAQMRIRASLPRDLPPGAKVMRVDVVNQRPPTLDIEYLVGDHAMLLRQRPAQSDPGFPTEAAPFSADGLEVRGLVHVDRSGRPVKAEVYWTRDGMDYVLAGGLPLDDLVRIARSVSRPT